MAFDECSALGWAVLGVARAHYDYDWPKATDEVRHAARLGHSDQDAHFWLGFLLLLQQQFEEALTCYDRACALDPHNPVMASHRALVTWALEDEVEAERAFQKIAAEHATFADVHALRAVPLARDGRWLDYAEANRRGAEITGGHPILRARQALGLRRGGRIAEAEALVEEVKAGAEGELASNIRVVLALAADDPDGRGSP